MTVTASTPNYRFRRGWEEFTTIPTPASTMINPGDLIWDNGGVAAVASAFTWDTNLATTQPEFRVKFLGVAMDQKLASDPYTTAIRVCTRGVFAYPCAALGAAHHIGECVNADKDTGNNLLDQQLAIVSGPTLSIGVLAEEAASGATELVVYLQSFLLYTVNATAS